jgi:hypothetical protein
MKIKQTEREREREREREGRSIEKDLFQVLFNIPHWSRKLPSISSFSFNEQGL